MRERVRYLGPTWLVTAVLLGLATLVGALVQGPSGALGAALGVVVVAASYTATTLAVAWADSVNPRLVLSVGVAMYITKFSLLGAMLIIVGASEWAGKLPMAGGIVAAIVVWTTAQIWWTLRHSYPYAKAS
jgi:hypothetical protein